MKSEPDVFSINHLKACYNSTSSWDGVRNYQARNFMKQMQVGDLVLFYHSSCKDVGIAGIAKVVKESYPDHTSWDKNSQYFDPKSSEDNPRWFMVDIQWVETFNSIISLETLKNQKELHDMKLVQKGSRLSVMPVTQIEFQHISALKK